MGLDGVEIVMKVEEAFGITIDEDGYPGPGVRAYNKTCGPLTWTKGPNKLKRIVEPTQQY